MTKKRHSREFRRARSDEQKEARRLDILRAARAHLAEVGFDAFSMGPLAKAAGVARGTLYLYFAGREEVLLTLYVEEAQSWLDEIIKQTGPQSSALQFLTVVYEAATRSPLFLELAPFVGSVIENNISVDSLIALKRQTYEMLTLIGEHAADLLGLPREQGVLLFTSLFSLLLGITQASRRPDIDVTTLPEETQHIMAVLDAKSVFLSAGTWLIRGAQHPEDGS